MKQYQMRIRLSGNWGEHEVYAWVLVFKFWIVIYRAIKFLETGQPGEYERMEGETEMTPGEDLPLPSNEESKDISVIPVTSNQSEANQITANQNTANTGATDEEPVAV